MGVLSTVSRRNVHIHPGLGVVDLWRCHTAYDTQIHTQTFTHMHLEGAKHWVHVLVPVAQLLAVALSYVVEWKMQYMATMLCLLHDKPCDLDMLHYTVIYKPAEPRQYSVHLITIQK